MDNHMQNGINLFTKRMNLKYVHHIYLYITFATLDTSPTRSTRRTCPIHLVTCITAPRATFKGTILSPEVVITF